MAQAKMGGPKVPGMEDAGELRMYALNGLQPAPALAGLTRCCPCALQPWMP
jgi:hypothetical protein